MDRGNWKRNLKRRQLSYIKQRFHSSDANSNDNTNSVVNQNYSEFENVIWLFSILIAFIFYVLFGSVILMDMVTGNVDGHPFDEPYFMHYGVIVSLFIIGISAFLFLKQLCCITDLFKGIFIMIFFPLTVTAFVYHNLFSGWIPISIATAFVFLLGMVKRY